VVAHKHLWSLFGGLLGAAIAGGSCLLPGYEVTGHGGTAGGGGAGLAGGGGGTGLTGGGGGGAACVERPPECTPESDLDCGECGRACDAGDACSDDKLCTAEEIETGDAWFMDYHDGLLYWSTGNPIAVTNGHIVRLDLRDESTVGSSNVSAPTGLSVDPNYVWWTSPVFGGVVFRAPHVGSGEESLYSDFPDTPTGVAASEKYVIFGVDGFDGSIERGPYDGEAVDDHTQLTGAGYPVDLVVRGDKVYWTTRGSMNSATPAGVWRRGLTSGPVEELFVEAGNKEYAELAIDGSHIYWASEAGVQRIALDGPFPASGPEFVSTAPATGVVVDAGAVYWVEQESGRVMKRSKYCDGWGEPVLLFQGATWASGMGVSRSLAVGEGRVFFSSDGKILNLPD